MQVLSTNIGSSTEVVWRGKTITTGIFKYPTESGIQLEHEQVRSDTIADRKVHGGVYKACYLFSAHHYPYWKEKYPTLEWDWGMLGENLTMDRLEEDRLRIGSIYRLGTALVQVTQPREPCFKLCIRFIDLGILKAFIDHGHPGTYVKVLEQGTVQKGDRMELIEESGNPLTIQAFYRLLFEREKDPETLKLAIANEALPSYKRERLKKWL